MIRTPYECLYVRVSNFLIMFNQCHKLTDGPERVKEIEIEREIEKERERVRKREKEREKVNERETERERKRERQRGRERETEREINRQINGQINKQTNRERNKEKEEEKERDGFSWKNMKPLIQKLIFNLQTIMAVIDISPYTLEVRQ